MFLGVPYALSPTGDKRWKPPYPEPGWKGVRVADSFAPACPQPPESVRVASVEVKEFGESLP
jgi:carboxylesterase type B